jgi:5-methylcytosine-specific restriction enzyme subunit McrC
MSKTELIQVFEHQALRLNQEVSKVKFTKEHLEALQKYHGSSENNKFLYFSLINNGVKFSEYVGVLQVGNLTIEVLPKTDRSKEDVNDQVKKQYWHGFLINMLKTAGVIDVKSNGYSSLRLKSNSILKLYFEFFIKEANYLLRTGVVKKYRKTSGNSFSLKGSLVFSKNIQLNITHAERFYVNYTTYDQNNIFNRIIYKTIKLLSQINTSSSLSSDIQNLILNFPEVPDMHVNDLTFEKLIFDRKTESYRKAINIARLILLNYHPDIRKGSNNVLALMFDMNKLWEKYILKLLKREMGDKYQFPDQSPTPFWIPENKGRIMNIKPDIIVKDKTTKKAIVVLDTKWKNLKTNRPDDDDIKQMLTYNLYNVDNSMDLRRSALVYPTEKQREIFVGNYSIASHGTCSLIFIPLENNQGVIKINLNPLKDFINSKATESTS